MALGINQISANSWQEVYKKVKKAVVFLDNPCAECLHWQRGFLELFNFGATSVKEFSSFESGSKNDQKAVFIISGPVIGDTRDILKDIIANSSFEYCILIMACSPLIQGTAQDEMWDSGGTRSAYYQLEQEMLHWMGNEDYTVEILNFPLFFASITSTLFVTPPFSYVFPLFKEESMDSCGFGAVKPLEFKNLPKDKKLWVKNLASSLHSLMTHLDISEDIYSLGNLSGIIASHLETLNSATAHRKNTSKKACLILIDRILDLGNAASFSSESLMDRIRTILPRLPNHSNDVAVELSPLCRGRVGSVAPGCLAHEGPVLEWLVDLKQKDVLLKLYHELQNRSEIPVKRLLRITPQVLEKQTISSFSGNHKLIINNCGFIQQTLGVTEALKSVKNTPVELAMSIEKLLLLTMAADGGTSGAVNQILQLIRCRHERNLDLEILLSILVQLYSIVGSQFTFTADDEMMLQGEISKALYNDRCLLQNTQLGFTASSDMTTKEADVIGLHIMNILHSVGSSRNHLAKYRNVLKNEGPMQPLLYNSLLDQLLGDLTDAHKPPIPDMVNKSEGLFKSGFSKLLSSSKHPSDHQNFIIFIVGGITGQETHKIVESFKEVGKNVLVGSTKLVSPSDILNLLFQDSICNMYSDSLY